VVAAATADATYVGWFDTGDRPRGGVRRVLIAPKPLRASSRAADVDAS
jgi:hypothetical protein